MRTIILMASLMSLAAACGKKGNTTPDDGEEHTDPVGPGGGPKFESGGAQIPPEKIDEANRLLERKGNVVARCLGVAVDNKELPKNSRGKMTLTIIIDKTGHASTIKVAQTSLESKSLEECVKGHVQKIQFPEMPRDFETSYTYGFEAM